MSHFLQVNRPMRATVDAKTFSDALKKVGAVLKKSVLPVLEEVCVRFADGRCILTATDLNTWIITEFPARGDDFAFVFSRTKDVERVCRYFSGDMTLEIVETGDEKHSYPVVTVSGGSRAGEFDAYPAEDYPKAPEVQGDILFTANAAALLERVNKVAYATRKPAQDSRDSLSCVGFTSNQIFALDGYRAAWDLNSALSFPQPFLVHAEQMSILKMLGDVQVDFHLSDSLLYVTGGNTTVIFQTTEGKLFDLQGAIPQTFVEGFFVSPKKILGELKYLNDAAPKTKTPYVYLHDNELFMTVKGRKYSAAIDISRQSAMTIGFHLRYMTDAFRQFEKEPQVKVKISGVNTPAVIEAEGRNDRAMLVPVRVKENAAA